MAEVKGEQAVFSPSEVIFDEGDQSDSLLFIQEGRVEVFRERNGIEIQLGIMGAGEFLGTVTLFSKEPRTASARALAQTKVLVMRPSQLEQGLKDVPTWMQAVVKDTVARLKHVDERLVETKLRERSLAHKLGTPLHVAAQICRYISASSKYAVVDHEGQPHVVLAGIQAALSSVLLKRLEVVTAVYGALTKSGIIKEVNGKSGLCTPKETCPQLEEFATFALNVTKSGPAGFLPTKLINWANAFLKARQKLPPGEMVPKKDLFAQTEKDIGREGAEQAAFELSEVQFLKINGENISLNAQTQEKRLVFEVACRALQELEND